MNKQINISEITEKATIRFYKSKKYVRKRDMQLFYRCKFLSKDDIEFFEQLSLIHIKNIVHDSKIEQNFYHVLDNFIFGNYFNRNFFTSFEMMRIIFYRLSLLSNKLFLKDIKYHFRGILNDNIAKLKTYKKVKNAIYFLQTLPNTQSDIESFINKCIEICSNDKIDTLIINPMNLIITPELKNKQQNIHELSKNLAQIISNLNAKTLVLDNDSMLIDEVLGSVEICVNAVAYHLDITISLQGYNLLSLESLEKIVALSKKLSKNKKSKLCVRLKDLDFYYEYTNFKCSSNHLLNANFANPLNATSNLIALIYKCYEYKDFIVFHLVSTNFILTQLIQQLDMPIRFEVEANLHYPLYKAMQQTNMSIIATQYYTNDFINTFSLRLKASKTNLNYGLLKYISMLQNKQEWDKELNAFEHSFQYMQKNLKTDILKDSSILLQQKSYNFETFDYELRKPLKIGKKNIDSKETKNDNVAFLHLLDDMQFSISNTNKLEDILYLNAQDTHRLSMQGMNNTPNVFSLYEEKEKEALEHAYKKQDEILSNRINIITSAIAVLKENINGIFATLCEIYPHTPTYIFEEQTYMVIDAFKYYAYEYKKLLKETDSVLLMPLGNIFVHTKKLLIHEIASIIASNVMIGNVTFLEDCLFSRIFYYVFKSICETCPFICIADIESMKEKNIIDYEIISKQDFIKLNIQKNSNFLVWDKGVSVVFISSFYDIHEAFLQVQNMRLCGDLKILIYTDDYIYDLAKQIFIPLKVECISLANLIANLPNDTSNFSLFTYNKSEINYAINKLRVSISINALYKSKLVSGSQRTFSPGYLQPFGSKLLLNKLVQTSPSSVIRNNSLYSDIISCFNPFLSVDEIEFLYNLNHNYSQFLNNLQRIASFDNIYEVKKVYSLYLRVYENDDFFHVCVIMLIAFLLQIETQISFVKDYFAKNPNIHKRLQEELKEKHIDSFTLIFENEDEFIKKINSDSLIRILQDENGFSNTQTYKELKNMGIIAEYSLPILNKNLELERYISTQYIQIEPNIFLQAHVDSKK